MFPWLLALQHAFAQMTHLFMKPFQLHQCFSLFADHQAFLFLKFCSLPPPASLSYWKNPVLPKTKITETNKITQQWLVAQFLRSRVLYRPTQWRCHKEKPSDSFVGGGVTFLQNKKNSCEVFQSHCQNYVFTKRKDRAKETNRENTQRHHLKNRCFMTGQNRVKQKKNCDKA